MQVQAGDAAGNWSTDGPRLEVRTAPEDPAKTAPKNDLSVSTDIADSNRFLFEAADPVQLGVAAGTIETRRFAVLHGRVKATDDAALAGVKVSAVGHPELGSTVTREDGRYDYVVNGGEAVQLLFTLPGHVEVLRRPSVPWRDHVVLDDVVLTTLDSAVTSWSMGLPVRQLAQSSESTDSAGKRRALLMLPEGTGAALLMPDGSKKSVATLHVRLTEWTVGEQLRRKAVAPIPPSSAITYGFAATADEAITSGAAHVEFDKPVTIYIANQFGITAGQDVPWGQYDAAGARWIPEVSGKVVKIVGVEAGVAMLEIGDGVSATKDQLDALGITEAERMDLAKSFSAGEVLWRVSMSHFSLCNISWTIALAADAKEPTLASPYGDRSEDTDCREGGSVITCRNQGLGEEIPVPGTPLRLRYSSERAPGRSATRHLTIPLAIEKPPASVNRIEWSAQIAGRLFQGTVAPDKDLSALVDWDGKDYLGRDVQGAQPVTTSVAWYYTPKLVMPPRYAFYPGGLPPMPVEAREGVPLGGTSQTQLGTLDARAEGFGGWSLAGTTRFDRGADVVHLGGGGRVSLREQPWRLETVAGKLFVPTEPFGPETGPATSAKLSSPRHVIAAADGGFYFADDLTSSGVFHVSADGALTRVAGGGSSEDETVDALKAHLTSIMGLAIGTDGALYLHDGRCIRKLDGTTLRTVYGKYSSTTVVPDGANAATGAATGQIPGVDLVSMPDGSFLFVTPGYGAYSSDPMANRVRRVSPDGFVTTVIGAGGYDGFGGDFGLAVGAALAHPTRPVVAPNGSIFFADGSNYRVREVRLDGRIYTIAGTGVGYVGESGDGGAATSARLDSPYAVAIGADGTTFIASSNDVRAVRDGVIQTIGGGGPYGYSDSAIAVGAGMRKLREIALAPDGSLLVADPENHVIRRLRRLTGGAVPDPSGTVLHTFDPNGRESATIDATTGKTIASMTYDASGHLTKLTDGNGDAVVIARDAAGNPTQIVGPYGDTTTLTVDADGNLSSVAPAGGPALTFTYAPGGLLKSATDASGGAHAFTYDALGRLAADSSPGGRSLTFSRVEAPTKFTTTATTALGRASSWSVETLGPGAKRYVTSGPDGLKTTVESDNGGGFTATLPDGTTMKRVVNGDARFGALAPLSSTTITGGGLTSTWSSSRSAVMSTSAGVVASSSGRIDLNGGDGAGGFTYKSEYDATSKTLFATTPEGRKIGFDLDDAGRPVKATTPGVIPIAIAYDTHGRVSKMTQGVRTLELTFDSSGRVSSVKDPAGGNHAYAYDSSGRVTKHILPDLRATTVTYDATGNVTSLTPPSSGKHLFDFDTSGALSLHQPPAVAEGSTPTKFTSDADGKLVQVERADGSLIKLFYDAVGRPTKLTYPDGYIQTSYSTANGLVASITTGEQTTSFTFNGSLPVQEVHSGVVSATLRRTYDNRMLLTNEAVGYGVGEPVKYGRDRDGLLTSVGDIVVSRDTTNGRATRVTLGSVVEALDFDAYGTVSSRTVTLGSTLLFKEALKKNDGGRIVGRTESRASAPDVAFAYTFDSSSRLVRVDKDSTTVETYGWDNAGNRTTAGDGITAVAATFDAQDRVLTSGSKAYIHGRNGEIQKVTSGADVTLLTYDALGNLRKVTLPSGKVIEYVIDPEGRRVARKYDAVVTDRWVYRNEGKIVAEVDAAGSVTSRYLYALRGWVPDAVVRGGKTYRIISDTLGNVRLVVDVATGDVVQRMDYDAFGRVVTDVVAPGWKPIPFGFAGGLYDRDTGLVRFGARDYDPTLGRWTSKDPALFGGLDTNLYRYAHGDPVNLIDVDGKGVFAVVAVVGLVASVTLGFGMSAPSDTADAPADIIGMALSVPGAGAVVGKATGAALGAVVDDLKMLNAVDSLAASGAIEVNNAIILPRPPRVLVGALEDVSVTLARITDEEVAKLAANPQLIRSLLSPAEVACVESGRFWSANFGKAVENAVARRVQVEAPSLLKYVGRPTYGRPIWDFTGQNAAAGRIFDLTTEGGIASHLARPYANQGARGLELIVYDAPYPWNLP